MEPVGPAPAGHQAAGELVDDDDLAVLHDVVDVPPEQGVGAKPLLDVVQHRHVARVVQVLDVQEALAGGDPLLGQRDRPRLLVDDEVALLLGLDLGELALDDRRRPPELRDDPVDLVVEIRRLVGRARDDERGPRLVDQDRVDLVDDGVVELALHQLLEAEPHVVAQVVEPELVVRAVGDVGPVGLGPRARPERRQPDVGRHELRVVEKRRLVLDDADAQAERLIDGPHPLRVALGQVVVDRDDVHAAAGERVQVRRQGRDERLALARRHLGDRAVVEHHAADQLHVEVAHPDVATGRLTADGKGLRQDLVERLATLDPLLELLGLRAEAGVVERGERGLERVDGLHHRHHAFDVALVLGAEDLLQQRIDHVVLIIQGAFARPADPEARERGPARSR